MEFLPLLFELCLIPLFGILTAFIVKWLKAKETEITTKVDNDTADKYISMVMSTVRDCVVATNQTYVESLKQQGSFDAEAQKNAFKATYESVLNILSDDAKEYLIHAYGDLNAYLTTLIEAEVNCNK
jgi:hypothetical protein